MIKIQRINHGGITSITLKEHLNGNHNCYYLVKSRSITFKATPDPHNCGNINIGNINVYNCTNPKEVINKELSRLKTLLAKADDNRNHIMGTINHQQKLRFGNTLKEAGFKIKRLFKNDNSNNQCYLISKTI